MYDSGVAIEYNGLPYHKAERKKELNKQKRELCELLGTLLITVEENKTRNFHDKDKHVVFCVPRQDNSHIDFVMECINRELIDVGSIVLPIKIDIATDRQNIYAQYWQSVYEKSFAAKFSHLLQDWDYEKNTISPEYVYAHSRTPVHWKCGKGHSYEMFVSSRAQNQGCPYCARKRVSVDYNLQAVNPPFLPEWDSDKNGLLKPCHMFPHSSKKVWWKCKRGHSWPASVKSRQQGNRCPVCAKKIIVAGENDFATTHTKMVNDEWDFEKNEILPTSISYGTVKKVWWKCKHGHSWQASVNSRTNSKSGCPFCYRERRRKL